VRTDRDRLLTLHPNAVGPDHEKRRGRRLVLQALVAGSAFGAFFILIDRAGVDAGHWPLLSSRLASLVALVAFARARGSPLRPELGARGKAAAAGCLDMSGNVFFLLAVHRGLLPLVTVLTSMYPLMTVVLARSVLNERLRASRIAGLLFAMSGVALMALG
jgi:drug/metabolite transporter (DMT)-like permease